jgi:hypothetical protein
MATTLSRVKVQGEKNLSRTNGLFPTPGVVHLVIVDKILVGLIFWPGPPGSASVSLEEEMMARNLTTALTLLAAAALFQPLNAQDKPGYKWDSERPDARAPMSITEDRVLPKGGFQLGFRYLYTDMGGQGYGTDSLTVNQVLSLFDVSPSGLASQSFALDLVYGLADRITLSATGNFAQKTMDHLSTLEGQSNAYLFYQTEASGIQDVKVSALYEVLRAQDYRFHVNAGVSVPIGSIDADAVTPFSGTRPTQLPYSQQLGSGTLDLLPGFTFGMQNKRASFGLQGKATIRIGENDRGWTLGDVYGANMWAGLKASDWVSVSLGARYSSWGNVEGFDEDLNPNESPAHNTLTQAGWRVDLPFGMNFVMPEGQLAGHRLGVEFLFPIHQDLDGPQLKHKWSIAAGWSMDLSF